MLWPNLMDFLHAADKALPDNPGISQFSSPTCLCDRHICGRPCHCISPTLRRLLCLPASETGKQQLLLVHSTACHICVWLEQGP